MASGLCSRVNGRSQTRFLGERGFELSSNASRILFCHSAILRPIIFNRELPADAMNKLYSHIGVDRI